MWSLHVYIVIVPTTSVPNRNALCKTMLATKKKYEMNECVDYVKNGIPTIISFIFKLVGIL